MVGSNIQGQQPLHAFGLHETNDTEITIYSWLGLVRPTNYSCSTSDKHEE